MIIASGVINSSMASILASSAFDSNNPIRNRTQFVSATSPPLWQKVAPLLISTLSLFGSACDCGDGRSAAPTAAITSSAPSAPVEPTDPTRRQNLDFQGQPGHGSIQFIRVIHASRYFKGSIRQIPKQFLNSTGRYQFKVLEELAQARPKHVFVEGLASELNSVELSHPPSRHPFHKAISVGDILAAFPQGVPAEPNDMQLRYLFKAGAPFIYGVLFSGVTLHATITLEQDEEISRMERELILSVPPERISAGVAKMIQEGKLKVGPNQQKIQIDPRDYFDQEQKNRYHYFTHTLRDSYAVQHIVAFLKKHPSAEVHLVYGAAHNFCDELATSELQAQLTSVWWAQADVNMDDATMNETIKACPVINQ